MWSGGDRSSLLTVKNVYTTITNTLWLNNIGGWRKQLGSWNIAQKIKLFTWLTIEKKYTLGIIFKGKAGLDPTCVNYAIVMKRL
jgi:hypothetical protein